MSTPNIAYTHFSPREFEEKALEIFRYQAKHNAVYRQFIQYLGKDEASVYQLEDIPFLPISFFKDAEVLSSNKPVQKVFTSSGTTGMQPSRHFITNLDLYHRQLDQSFQHFYGHIQAYQIFPLLPAYAEREGSSLIDMVDYWMQQTKQKNKTYYLYNHSQLAKDIAQAQTTDKKIILIGVSFALLDFAEKFPIDLSSCIIIETGGMKGRKKEMTRKELHNTLKKAFHCQEIQSEYGMTELLSQAYAPANGLFQTPPWMKIMLRDPEDPLSYVPMGKSGGINVIDFANIHSCAFIATDDLGRYHAENKLEILGRFDHSDVRGCNLLVL